MPEPFLIEIAIAPTSSADQAQLLAAFDRLAADDPRLALSLDSESGQILLEGTREEDLDGAIATARKASGIAFAVGTPRIAYRETISRQVETDYTHKKRTVDGGQFARVKIVCAPDEVGGCASNVVGGAIPDSYVCGVERGVASAMRTGVVAGFQVIQVKATLIDGAYHDTDSSAMTFEIAGREACREALSRGGPVLLEPIMRVEVTVPEAYAGFVIGDLLARRGKIRERDLRGDTAFVDADVPFANMLGYADQLRSGTRGHGTYAMRFKSYAALPPPDGDGPSTPAIALRR